MGRKIGSGRAGKGNWALGRNIELCLSLDHVKLHLCNHHVINDVIVKCNDW